MRLAKFAFSSTRELLLLDATAKWTASQVCLSKCNIFTTPHFGTEESEKEKPGQSQSTKPDGQGWFNNIFFKSGDRFKESQSDLLSDQNNVFELQFHNVKPARMGEYLKEYEGFVKTVHECQDNARLVASWTVEIGAQDRAVHLWQFAGGYPALNKFCEFYRKSSNFNEFRRVRNSLLQSRSNQICLPFSFWPQIRPRGSPSDRHIYELRAYTLRPGTMIEWGNSWVKGITSRSEDDAVTGLFTHVGAMHIVYHIWAYKNLEHRRKVREEAWRIPGWDECVLLTVPLIRHMDSSILQPTPFSPMQ